MKVDVHLLRRGVGDVSESLFLVHAYDSARAVYANEIPAVAVVIAQQPVGDVLALELGYDVRVRERAAVAALPAFEVKGDVCVIDAKLRCAKPRSFGRIERDGFDRHGGVQVYDALHFVTGFLHISAERLAMAAVLALCRFEQPFAPVRVRVLVHLARPHLVTALVVERADVGRIWHGDLQALLRRCCALWRCRRRGGGLWRRRFKDGDILV